MLHSSTFSRLAHALIDVHEVLRELRGEREVERAGDRLVLRAQPRDRRVRQRRGGARDLGDVARPVEPVRGLRRDGDDDDDTAYVPTPPRPLAVADAPVNEVAPQPAGIPPLRPATSSQPPVQVAPQPVIVKAVPAQRHAVATSNLKPEGGSDRSEKPAATSPTQTSI